MKARVEKALDGDLDWMLVELKKFSKFYGTTLQVFQNEENTRRIVQGIIAEHVAFVAWKGSERIGFIMGYCIPHQYNPDIRMLTESAWWVQEEHRLSRAGLMLLDKFTEWGKDNVDWITFSLEHHSPVKDTCLTKRGYAPQERSFLLEV